MRGKVAVIGVGMIRFGELFEKSLENMIQEAYLNCLKNVDKGIDPKEIKAKLAAKADEEEPED
jgi:acetyl-CoA C-acetyltransferase